MSTYIGIGRSHSDEPAIAGEESVRAALHGIGDQTPDIIFVYATFGYDFPALLRSIRAAGHGVPVVGGSTLGIITHDGPEDEFHRVSVCVMKSDEFKMHPFVVQGLLGRSSAAGKEFADKLRATGVDDARGLFLFLDGLKAADPDAFLREVDEVLPKGVPVFGGTASEPLLWKNTYQFFGDDVLEDAAVGVLFSGKVDIIVTSSHGSRDLGVIHEVTKAEGPRIYEIDGRPAIGLFTDLYGEEGREISAATAAGVCLGVRTDDTSSNDQHIELRVPLASEDDGSIIMAAAWPAGTKIYLCQRDPARILEQAKQAASSLVEQRGGARPLVVFHADCVGRSIDQIGRDAAVAEVRATIDAFPADTPWFGAYVYGELAPVGGKSGFHNWTGAIASFYSQ